MISLRRSLGKGLESILNAAKIEHEGSAQNLNSSLNLDVAQSPNEKQVLKTLKLQQMTPGAFQPRKDFSAESLQELSDSIKHQGLLQPIIVRERGLGAGTTDSADYEIIAGERRWRASQMAGLTTIPAIVCNVDDKSALAFALIENIQRKDLNPIEEAHALQRLITEFAMTHEAVAKAIGRSRALVTNTLRLLNLSEPLQVLLIANQIEMGHARAVLGLSAAQQVQAIDLIIKNNMTVRAAEELVRTWDVTGLPHGQPADPLNPYLKVNKDPRITQWAAEISRVFGMSAQIKMGDHGQGRVVLTFRSLEELTARLEDLKTNYLVR